MLVGAPGLPIAVTVAAEDATDVPAALVAVTRTEYEVPAVKFAIEQVKVDAFVAQVKGVPPPTGVAVTVYPVIELPPPDDGASHDATNEGEDEKLAFAPKLRGADGAAFVNA